jgi:hypothetical protein
VSRLCLGEFAKNLNTKDFIPLSPGVGLGAEKEPSRITISLGEKPAFLIKAGLPPVAPKPPKSQNKILLFWLAHILDLIFVIFILTIVSFFWGHGLGLNPAEKITIIYGSYFIYALCFWVFAGTTLGYFLLKKE